MDEIVDALLFKSQLEFCKGFTVSSSHALFILLFKIAAVLPCAASTMFGTVFVVVRVFISMIVTVKPSVTRTSIRFGISISTYFMLTSCAAVYLLPPNATAVGHPLS